MKKIKQFLSGILSAAMLLTVASAVYAADVVFSDVSIGSWYAEAVQYVSENGIMSGTGNDLFSPREETSRAMLASILYRESGSPAVNTDNSFTDVQSGKWYENAVKWATENGIMSGYGNSLFGTDDPVTREQIAAILWRYAGSPEGGETENFTDESGISSYATEAVDWAKSEGIVNGRDNNRFDPQGNASRAEVAVILFNFMNREKEPEKPAEPEKSDKSADDDILVVYFSATGSTKSVAETIAETLDADIFEIVPADPYTAEDLDWTEDSSRVNAEHDNPSFRAVELVSDTVENWEDYDTVLIGYPIWWGIAAWPVDSFVSANDFTGKTVIPFCTSASSGLGESGELLAELAGNGNWLEGQRFSSGVGEVDVTEWVNSLNLNTDSSETPSES